MFREEHKTERRLFSCREKKCGKGKEKKIMLCNYVTHSNNNDNDKTPKKTNRSATPGAKKTLGGVERYALSVLKGNDTESAFPHWLPIKAGIEPKVKLASRFCLHWSAAANRLCGECKAGRECLRRAELCGEPGELTAAVAGPWTAKRRGADEQGQPIGGTTGRP